MEVPEIVIDRISFTYPNLVPALHEVSLRVRPGEQVAIVGQNGSGKTTLARHLNGLLRPQQGLITLGRAATHDSAVSQLARQVGYLFQNPDEQLFKRSVAAEIAFGPRNLGLPAAQVAELVGRVLAETGLTAVAGENPHDLGWSWRRRVALGAVMAMETPILVLDEPTTGQDAHFYAMLGRLLTTWRTAGRTVIVVSHDLDFVAAHFSRLIVMQAGRILQDGPVRDLLGNGPLLQETGVDPPLITQLAEAVGLRGTILDIPEFLQAYRSLKA
jgi:energy-coupling factor transport system ATP-binding protein